MPSPSELLGGPPHQDYIILAGAPSPTAVVKGAGSPRRWDIRDGYGLTGSTVVFTGQGLAAFDVDIYAWEPEHFVLWQAFARLTLVNPPIGARPTSMSIAHPMLNDPPLSIKQVVVTNVTQWEQDPEGGGLFCRTISFLEYRKPRPALVKPFEGPPGSPVNVKPPVDPEVAQIAANQATIAALGNAK
jgi:hypothetical protein